MGAGIGIGERAKERGDTMKFKWDYEVTMSDGSKVEFVAHQIIHVACLANDITGYNIQVTDSSGTAVGEISESEFCNVMGACGESYW
jgi:hypothetical protein